MNWEMNKIYNCDCLEAMREIPDKFFELAIVDPPYGIKILTQFERTIKSKSSMMNKSNGIVGGDWDNEIPDREYFEELERISKRRIIWGGNYFLEYLSSTKSLIIWDKMNGTNPMADAEIAWTDFDKSIKIFRLHHFSKGYDKKVHPTQKPVKLYKWTLTNFAQPGDKILDTHVGSASSIIACYDGGFEYMAFEKDPLHYRRAVERVNEHKSQLRIEDIITK